MIRSALAVVVFAGCSFRSGSATVDASGDDDSRRDAPDSDGSSPSCDATSWADGLVPGGTTIYVAPTTTGTPDGSQAHPFTTVAAAAAIATPGSRISLAAGTYAGEVIGQLHGTATAPVWIEGPTTAPRATFTTSQLQLVQPQYVVIRHLDFTNIAGSALVLDDGGDRANLVAHHIAIDDVAASMIGQRAFLLTGVSNVTIARSSATSSANAMLLVGSHHVVVSRFVAASLANIGIETAGGSDDIEIRQSKLTDPGLRAIWIGGNSTELEFRPPLVNATGNFEASNIRVFDNVIDSAAGATAIACSLCTDSLIAANYIHGAYSYVVRLIDEHGPLGGKAFVASGGIRMVDNAMEVTNDPYGFRVEAGTDGTTCTFANNLWYEIDNPANSTPMLPTAEPGGIYGVPSGYGLDGHVCTGAAVAAGVSEPGVVGTLEGSCRPTTRSIGPDEPAPGC